MNPEGISISRPIPPHRKAMRRREVRFGSRFVTFSCQGRLPLLGHPGIRDLFVDALRAARETHGFDLFAWVVMPEHAHLLLEPKENQRLEPALRSMKMSVAKRVIGRWEELKAPILERIRTKAGVPRFWLRGGGFDRNVRDEEEFCKEVTYIHRNPVERGLVAAPRDWKWSSVRWWMGERGGEFECDNPPGWERGLKLWQGYQ